MSEAPKRQFAYIIGATRDGPLKIGVSQNPTNRLASLQTGSHNQLRLFWVYPCPRGDLIERLMHQILSQWRHKGEWFNVPIEAAMAALWIASQADEKGARDEEIREWRTHIGFEAIGGVLAELETSE